MGNLVVLAVIPGIIMMIMVYRMDKVEKEPKKLLLKLLLFGAISMIPAVLLEMLGENLLLGEVSEDAYGYVELFIDNFIIVGFAEEFSKYIMLKKGSWKNKAFDYRFDAVVYAVVVSMGFAIPENIMYVLDNGFANAIVRALVSVPGHAAFGVAMGIYYGQAKYYECRGDKRGKRRNLRKAVIVPLLMHGFFDFCLSADSAVFLILFLIYVATVDITSVKKLKKYSQGDTRLSAYPQEFEASQLTFDNPN